MTETEIYQQLTEIFHDVFVDDSIVLSRETAAPDVPGWDSFNHINLVVAVEQHFGIKFHVAELEGLQNVGGLVALIEQRLAKTA